MRNSVRLQLLVWIMVWSAGCAPVQAVTPTSTGPAGLPSPTAHASKPAPTATAGPQATPTAGQGVAVDVTLSDNKISSSLTAFRVGVPYTFLVKNTGTHALCFDIAQPVDVTGSLGASQTTALVSIPLSHLAVGITATATYTFSDSATGMKLEFSCLLRRPYGDNVRLPITVTK